MKKVLIIGAGAQGSAAARRLDEDPAVSELLIAGHGMETVNNVVSTLRKAKGVYVEAHDRNSIIEAARGVDLILNALPLECTENVLEAALEVGADYQDYAGTNALEKMWMESSLFDPENEPDFEDDDTRAWYRSFCALYELYGPRFQEKGLLALFGTGSAPGLICCASRRAVRELDTCDTIYNMVWEGVFAKRFQPFWWSPVTALNDMSLMGVALEDGKLINTPAFGNPMVRQFSYMDEPVTFREHCHDEPLQYSFHKDTHFKGLKNAFFKYAGAGMDFCRPLYEAGLLSHEKEIWNGREIVPVEYILSHVPPAPKLEEEIRVFVEEGLALDSGCMVVEAYGKKDGKDTKVTIHVNAPGFVESFEREKMTGEMYLTGQGGYLFSRLFLDGSFDKMSGMISSDMLTEEQIDQYFRYAQNLDISLDLSVENI